MKSDNLYAIADIIRASTTYGFIAASLVVTLGVINNSDKLVGDRFAYVLGVAGAFSGAAAAAYSPQQRQQPQTRVNHADEIQIDQSK